jgi:ribonuclease Z
MAEQESRPPYDVVVRMIRVTFLGTAASRPTVGRNVSGIALQREGDLMLFDCGEGTQRQMMRFGSGFNVAAIFVTHLHADHFIGIIGLLRTMALQGRQERLDIYGPPRSGDVLQQAAYLGSEKVPFPLGIRELHSGEEVPFGEYDVTPFSVDHLTPALGYALREHPRLGRFDVERARALGVPEGPLFGRLHRGEPVEVGGRVVSPEEVVGDPRPGRLVAYTGDTRPSLGTLEAARGADLLIHEATFAEDERDRAFETFHSTARGASILAAEAGVSRLALTHISARYAENPSPLLEEARPHFQATVVAHDGMTIELGYRSDEDPGRGRDGDQDRGGGEKAGGGSGGMIAGGVLDG